MWKLYLIVLIDFSPVTRRSKKKDKGTDEAVQFMDDKENGPKLKKTIKTPVSL